MANEADLRALYPFLHGAPQEPAKLDAALLHSIEEKARNSRETNTRFFAAEATILFGRRQDGRRCLPARRPPVLDGQRRVELRCLACRG